MTKKIEIGDTRTFDRYAGKWEVKEIIKDKNIKFDLVLKPVKCPYCGGKFGDKKGYIFNYIEKLELEGNIMYLGVSDCGRCVILNEYILKSKVEEVVKNGD